MHSSNNSTVEARSSHSGSPCGGNWGRSGRWTGINIAIMVIGFMMFWPIGLALLFWIMIGRSVLELPGVIRETWGRVFNGSSKIVQGSSDNVVFNDYQQTQYDRIREIKEEIKTRAQRFSEFRMGAQRRADQEEFDRFMASGAKHDNTEQ